MLNFLDHIKRKKKFKCNTHIFVLYFIIPPILDILICKDNI